MLTLLFIIIMFVVFGKIAVLMLKGVWGLTKIFFALLFLPIILIGFVVKGLIAIALPALIILVLVALLTGEGT